MLGYHPVDISLPSTNHLGTTKNCKDWSAWFVQDLVTSELQVATALLVIQALPNEANSLPHEKHMQTERGKIYIPFRLVCLNGKVRRKPIKKPATLMGKPSPNMLLCALLNRGHQESN